MSAASSSPPSQRDRQRADTRERIYRAALAEFHRVGCARAQIDRIARDAGVVRGTFYFHFPRKEHVLLELQARLEHRAVEQLAARWAGPPSLRDVLDAVVDAVVETEASLGDPRLFREMISIYVRPPDDPARAEQDFPLIREFAHRLSELAARGELRGGIAPPSLAVMFMTSVFGFLLTSDSALAERRADLEALVDVFIGGMAP